MSEDMVERVARALCAFFHRGRPGAADDITPIGFGPPQPWGPRWKLYEDLARAALEAMREPSDAFRRKPVPAVATAGVAPGGACYKTRTQERTRWKRSRTSRCPVARWPPNRR